MPDTPSESDTVRALQRKVAELETENQELRQQLQYAEEKFEQIVDQDPQIGWMIYNESLEAFYINQGWMKLTGRTIDEFNNTPEEDNFASAEEMERIRQVRADLFHLDEKALFRSRVHLKRKDGSTFWGEFISQNITWEGRKLRKTSLVNVDAEVKLQAQLEEANRELQDSEVRFRKMIDESIQGVAIVDAEGEILYINRVFLDTLGFESMEDCMRVPPQERMPPESLELTRARRAKRLSGEESPERYRHEIYRKDRSRIWVETLAHAIEWEGKPAVQVNIIDVDAEVRSRKKLESANELMTMGVGYGSRIQQAILPRTEEIRAAFRAFEVSWEPRDVVSGDFYWFHSEGARTWLMLGDCTGHGVPGAFMSLISLTVLDRIAYEGRVTDPAGMLQELGLLLRKSLRLDRPDAETDDGLDAAFCCFDTEANTVTYSGKILPLYRLRGGELEVIKGERGSVGYHTPNDEKPFANHTLDLQKGDRFVLISDGFVDQVCETTGRMYGPKRFRKQLAEHADLAVPELMRALLDDHAAEQGAHTRRDDLTLMALEV